LAGLLPSKLQTDRECVNYQSLFEVLNITNNVKLNCSAIYFRTGLSWDIQ